MSYQQDGRAIAGNQAVEASTKAARVAIVPRTTKSYAVAATSGILVAALAANSSVFAMRLDPGAGVRAYIERIRLGITTLTAFTTPVTAGRRLALFRGSGAQPSGGTALTPANKWTAGPAPSEFTTAQGGDVRISTTAALTVTGITFETTSLREFSMSHIGASGGFVEYLVDFAASEFCPIILEPGQLIAIRNPVVMDAAGTFQVSVAVDWHEAFALDDSSSE